MMHRKAADLQYQRPFHLNSSLVPFVVEILIAGYPNTIFIIRNFVESYNSTRTIKETVDFCRRSLSIPVFMRV